MTPCERCGGATGRGAAAVLCAPCLAAVLAEIAEPVPVPGGAPQPCQAPGCQRTTADRVWRRRARYCAEHEPPRAREDLRPRRRWRRTLRRKLKTWGYGLTAADILAIVRRQGRRCADPACRRRFPKLGTGWHFELDHTVPRARGGPDVAGNAQALCRRCNRRKAAIVYDQAAADRFGPPGVAVQGRLPGVWREG